MNVYNRANIATVTLAAFATLASVSQSLAQSAPSTIERFNSKWAPSSSPNSYGEPTDKLFKMDGNYCVPYGGAKPVCLEFSNVKVTPQSAQHGQMTLTVPAHQFQGAEVATGAGWLPAGPNPPFGPSHFGYGYYETLMKPSCVQGEISSFFWVEAPKYGPHELDVEFPNAPGHKFTDVHFTIHPSNSTIDYQLGFNPCQAFHRYGFLWQPGKITFTVDGKSAHTFTESDLVTTATGFIMANAWDGNPNWGAGPPSQDAVNVYEWMTYYADATVIPKR